MIFIDSNVPMYLVGADHPHKIDSHRAVERLLAARRRLVTDAGVLQEILHRYCAIERREAIQPACDVLLAMVDEVLPIERREALRAKDMVLGNRRLSARDAIHLAVMETHSIDEILSFDRGFDGLPGIVRLG